MSRGYFTQGIPPPLIAVRSVGAGVPVPATVVGTLGVEFAELVVFFDDDVGAGVEPLVDEAVEPPSAGDSSCFTVAWI